MSHYIIVNGVRKLGPHPNLVATDAADEQPEIRHDVLYRPQHGLSLDEQNKRMAKIRKLISRIEDVAAGDEAHDE